jgi:hypothetical protein
VDRAEAVLRLKTLVGCDLLIRNVIRTRGFHHLSGSMGTLVQPRTKGPGHGSTSRAFYARSKLVARILGITAA